MHGVCEIFEACFLGMAVFMSHFLSEVYPIVSFCAASCALLIGGHGVYRLIWRWRHGYSNLLSDHEVEDIKHHD